MRRFESRTARQTIIVSKSQARALEAHKQSHKLFTSERIPISSAPQAATIDLPALEHALKEHARRSFKEFVAQAMSIVEPGVKFMRSWATDAVCDHCQAVAEGAFPLDPGAPIRKEPIRNLIVNIPPRHLKSTIVAVLFPAWVWINFPNKRFIITSYSHRNTLRDSRKCRQLIESTWYQARWGQNFTLAEDSNTLIRYDNNKGGFRYAVSISGQIIGEGADIIIADDLHNLADIHSKKKRDKPNQIWDDVIPSRFSDPKTGCFICISQRAHGDDHTGHLLAKSGSVWVHLRLPAEFESKYRCETRLPWKDPRTKEGELIDPRRFGAEEIRKLKLDLGSWNASAQLQQRPVPLEGGIFEHDWWRYYKTNELPPINQWEDSCISCDMTFGSMKDSASYVVFQAWCRVGCKFYLLDQARGRWKYTDAKKRLRKFLAKWHFIYCIYVENKALGPAIIEDLEEEGISGLLPVEPDGDKVARASAISALVEAGNCYFPDPTQPGYEWVELDLLAEVDTFPLSANDDQVDTMSQAVRKLRGAIAFGVSSDEFNDQTPRGYIGQEEVMQSKDYSGFVLGILGGGPEMRKAKTDIDGGATPLPPTVPTDVTLSVNGNGVTQNGYTNGSSKKTFDSTDSFWDF